MDTIYSQAVEDQVKKSARDVRKVGIATERVTTYADDNTALVTAAAFGIGLLVGFLVARKS